MTPEEDDAEMPLERQRELVEAVAEVMEGSGRMESVHARPKARVPIVALKDQASGLKCDICMCKRLALINSRLLRAFMQLDPRARQVRRPGGGGPAPRSRSRHRTAHTLQCSRPDDVAARIYHQVLGEASRNQ